MTKRDIAAKFSIVDQHYRQAKSFSKVTLKQLQEDKLLRLAIERALFLVVQSTIDLVEAYCVWRNFRRPSSMHESIDILREEKVISEAQCDKLLKMVGFRNVLTHGYSKLDLTKVHAVLKVGLKDIKQLLGILDR
jgi:uncharacterized protein YutE (UPF0331/DUF86 family)